MNNNTKNFAVYKNTRLKWKALCTDIYALMVSTLDTNLLEEKNCMQDLSQIVQLVCGGAINAASILHNSFEILLAMDDLVTNGYYNRRPVNEILTFIKMDSVNEALMRQLNEDRAITNQNNLEKLSKIGNKLEEANQAFNEATKVGLENINNNIKNAQNITEINENNTNVISKSKKLNYSTQNEKQVSVITKEKIEMNFNREGEYLNGSLAGECWLKYSENTNYETAYATLLTSIPKSIIVKSHPNIDKDLYLAENILKPKKQMKGEFLCFKYTLKSLEMIKDAIKFSIWVQQFDDYQNVMIECESSIILKGGDFRVVLNLKNKQVNYDVENSMMKIENGQLVCILKDASQQFEFDYMDPDEDNLFPIALTINGEFQQSLADIEFKENEDLQVIHHVYTDKSFFN